MHEFLDAHVIQTTWIHLHLSFSTYLSFPVDADNPSCGIMGRSHKNGLPTDSVHVDASARLQVIQMNVTVFSDEIYNIVFGADLCDKRECNA